MNKSVKYNQVYNYIIQAQTSKKALFDKETNIIDKYLNNYPTIQRFHKNIINKIKNSI